MKMLVIVHDNRGLFGELGFIGFLGRIKGLGIFGIIKVYGDSSGIVKQNANIMSSIETYMSISRFIIGFSLGGRVRALYIN